MAEHLQFVLKEAFQEYPDLYIYLFIYLFIFNDTWSQ